MIPRYAVAAFVAFALSPCPGVGHLFAATPTQAAEQQTSRPTSTPYSGDLSIFEEPGRDKKLQIDRVMDILHIQQNSVVADIGAGSGWFTVRAARRVGRGGRVFAEDINPHAIEVRSRTAPKRKISRTCGSFWALRMIRSSRKGARRRCCC